MSNFEGQKIPPVTPEKLKTKKDFNFYSNKISQVSTLANSPNTISLNHSFNELDDVLEITELTSPISIIFEETPKTNSNHSIFDKKKLEIEKKKFSTKEEKTKFIEDYRKKIKTELCKNWELKGFCKFSDKCSFAHGKDNLKLKLCNKSNYKLKPCKNFFVKGFCMYGYRCQYIHSEIKKRPEFFPFLENVYKSKNIPITFNKTHYENLLMSYEYSFERMILNIASMINNGDDLEKAFNEVFKDYKRLDFFKDKMSSKKRNSNNF